MKTECKYPSELTNRQWQLIRQLLPPRAHRGWRHIDGEAQIEIEADAILP